MIRFEQVSVTYDGATAPSLAGVDLTVDEGELCLVVGSKNSNKTCVAVMLYMPKLILWHNTAAQLDGRAAKPPGQFAGRREEIGRCIGIT